MPPPFFCPQLVPARCQVGAEERWRYGQGPSQEESGRRTRLVEGLQCRQCDGEV